MPGASAYSSLQTNPACRHVLFMTSLSASRSRKRRRRLEGYLRTPAGPSALRQDNNRKRNPDSPRFRLLLRIFRARSLAQQFKLPVCDRDRLKSFTDGGLRS
jgi:hypothetical protein